MASFMTSARADKKINRRNAQAAKIATNNKQDDDFFWKCVQIEEHNKAANKFVKPSFATEDNLFQRQGTSGINFEQYDAIPVSRSGPDSSNIPDVANFINLKASLPAFLSENLTCPTRMNYSTPTPIQRHCVPLSLSGKFDVMACAQTGSGKTVAFLVPLIAHIATQLKPKTVQGKGEALVTPAVPSALVVAPTRELAIQIELEAHKLTFSSPLHCVCVYGGAPTRGQLALLAKGVDILVATPGRLTDFLQRSLIKLCATKFLVLDEADRMLDMGFEPQIRQICERFDLPAAHSRRTLMFSATFPDQVQRIAQKYMREYVFVAVGRVGSTINSITQRVIKSPMNDKRSKLEIILPLIDVTEKTLIFCQKKHVASWLSGQITKALAGVKVESIHGDRSQSQRESALNKFRAGEIDILVATDVAARGLDVPNITHVIQFDLPVAKDDFDSYVHRIGRTGRAGRLGVATSLFVPGMDAKSGQNGALWEPLNKLLEEGQQEVPAWFAELSPRSGGDVVGRGGESKASAKAKATKESGPANQKVAQQPERDSRAVVGVVTTSTMSVGKPSVNDNGHTANTGNSGVSGDARQPQQQSERKNQKLPSTASEKQQLSAPGGSVGIGNDKARRDSHPQASPFSDHGGARQQKQTRNRNTSSSGGASTAVVLQQPNQQQPRQKQPEQKQPDQQHNRVKQEPKKQEQPGREPKEAQTSSQSPINPMSSRGISGRRSNSGAKEKPLTSVKNSTINTKSGGRK